MRRDARPPVAIIGAGRLGRALIPLLAGSGHPVVAVADRRRPAARAAARLAPGARATTVPRRAVAPARLVLLAVPDGEIAPLAEELAEDRSVPWKGKTVLHHAGALGPEPLQPLRHRGARVGLLHPLQCVGSSTLASSILPGSGARVEGDAQACAVARRLARAVGMVPLPLPRTLSPAERTVYHAAAALLSNDLVALLGLGADLLESIGLERRAALRALAPLVRGTVTQAERKGLRAALSGPVVRGDAETVSRHLEALRAGGGGAGEIHRALSLELLRRVDESGGGLSPRARRALQGVLRESPASRGGKPTL